MSPRTLAGGCALVLALAAPSAAQAAPTIAPLKPCYVTAKTDTGRQREPMQITGAGFTPNASVDLTIDGEPVRDGSGLQADEFGNLPLPSIPAPFVRRGTRTFTVTLTEQQNPANTVSVTAKSTALGVSVKPEEARPSDRIRFKGSGFTEPGLGIYAHYIYKGKLRKTVRMARQPRDDCGGFEVRRRQIAVKRPGLGLWTIQFDQSADFVDPDVKPMVFVRLAIRIRLVRD
jgi:hypothetical protein